MDKEKWQKLSLALQIGNIGSEIAKAKHWEENNDAENKNSAIKRALTLIDLTINDRRWQTRLKEILRLREILADWLIGGNIYGFSPQGLENYCTSFVLAAKKSHQN